MGYFSNGTEGEMYKEQWCNRCIHDDDPCQVWLAHLLKNYDEHDNNESILHMLIPRSKDGIGNDKCKMFKDYEGRCKLTGELFNDAEGES